MPDKIIVQFQLVAKTGELFLLCSDGTLWKQLGSREWLKIQGPTE